MFSLPLLAVTSVVILAPAAVAPGRIVEVTVFPDRAGVVREIRLDLPAGRSMVEFPGLPWGVEPDSLRVTARGVPASLGTVDLKQQAREPVETPDTLTAREEVRRLESALAALDVEDETDAELRGFIAALKASTAARESEKMGEGKADPAALAAVYTFVRTGMQDLGKDKLARAGRRVMLGKDLEVARPRLAATGPAGAIRSRVATIEVQADRAGALTMRLAYLTPGVSWRPSYRASLDTAGSEVSLDSEGVVRQETGEDWSDVALKLSTAAPARGVAPPELTAWLLRPLPNSDLINEVEVITSGASAEYGRAEGGFSNLRIDGANLQAQAPPPPQVAAVRPQAGLVHTSYNVAFEAPGRVEIPSDGADHRVLLRQEKLPGRLEYRSVPSLNEAAFLVAKTTAPTAYPLLAGPVRVFAADAYLGSFNLGETGPGADLKIPFGIDNRISVTRTPLPQARSEAGIIGKDRRIAYSFTTTVENRLDRAATVIIEERIPVSEDERIEVEQGKQTTPGAAPVKERPGVIEWVFTLEPKQKKEIVLAYTVRFPREMTLPGIE